MEREIKDSKVHIQGDENRGDNSILVSEMIQLGVQISGE